MSTDKSAPWPAPWYVEMFLAIGGWLAGIFAAIAIFAIGVAIAGDFKSGGQDIAVCLIALLFGGGFIALGVFVGGPQKGDFARHFGISCIAAGLTAATFAVWYLAFKIFDAGGAPEATAIGSGGLCAAAMLAAAGFFLTRRVRDGILSFLTALAVYGVAVAALIVLHADDGIGWHSDHYATAAAAAFGAWLFARAEPGSVRQPAGAALLIGPVIYYTLITSFPALASGGDIHTHWLIAKIAFIASALYCLWLLRARYAPAPLAAASTLLIAGIWVLPNAGGVAILALLAAFAANHRGLAAVAVVGVIWFISRFYYDLSMTLLEKSALLAALGAATLGGAFFFRRLSKDSAGGEAQSGGGAQRNWLAILGFAALLALACAYVNYSVMRLENAFAEARRIYLPLGPVDPRSLIQGDYMTLNYRNTAYPPSQEIGALPRTGEVFLKLDENAVASFSRIPGENDVLDTDEIRIDYIKTADARMRYAPESYFFQEGEAHIYQPAHFAIVLVAPDGRAKLTGLADENLARLGEPN
ncbi:GDYXXLXY domain-containing protein [Hyphococcus luteus]|uniref:DUF4401 domain-containing protein n=1 Tax=Hyphococcus luteus TaxID=2058213 RepID=A0A2S7K6S3_9PROT|nr:GDYXXLXY domain-containing protein [Marinicaulis flavus]PQA88215.1 hypothetical protein CW354_07875 [Marinicaulis flavus]